MEKAPHIKADPSEPTADDETQKDGRKRLPNERPAGMAGSVVSAQPTVAASQNSRRKAEAEKDATVGRVACTECQRRKQKCNREWPCNNCVKRKIPRLCRFGAKPPIVAPNAPDAPTGQKRGPEEDADDSELSRKAVALQTPDEVEDPVGGFGAMGYGEGGHFFDSLKLTPSGKEDWRPRQTSMSIEECPQLGHALQTLPLRYHLDLLVRNFLHNVNFHHYIIYPKAFIREYAGWWDDRERGRPLGLEWTCLLLMVCACSVQFTGLNLANKLERSLDETCQSLSEKYHNMGRTLHSVIPVGKSYNVYNVQQLLHSCYWYKTEARSGESWHALGAAIREAQELGIHKERATDQVPDFQREINRRLWCILNTWDWQFSALLSRPLVIDRAGCDVELPRLAFESYSPSPLIHMRMLSALVTRLSARFGQPKKITSASEVREYQNLMEEWMTRLPPTFSMTNPDMSRDEVYPWIPLQRHYLHAVAYSMTLDPMRAVLATIVNSSTPEEIRQIRREGINYSLQLSKALQALFIHIWPREAKFYYLTLFAFDTAAVQANVLLHDAERTVERRDELVDAIGQALAILKHVASVTKLAGQYHNVLARLRKKVLRKLELSTSMESSGAKELILSIETYRPHASKLAATAIADELLDLDDDSQSYVSLASTPFEQHLSPRLSSISSPGERSQSGSGAHLEPPSSVIYPDGTLAANSFLDEQWPMQGQTAFYETAPSNHFSIGRSADTQEYDFAAAPPLENFSGPVPDGSFWNIPAEELGALADVWRWDNLDAGAPNDFVNEPMCER